jgi:glutamate-5-semialdehyde dehydrogenase
LASTDAKNAALLAMARKLRECEQDLLQSNEEDMARAVSEGVPENMVKRLQFGASKIASRIRCLQKIAALPDPVGQVLVQSRRPNGLDVARVRVPLGAILCIYEARPHVTINAGAFCLKSGNAAILRGGTEARGCNALLGELWYDSLREAGLPEQAVQVVSVSHEGVDELLGMDDCIDLVIPRGGKELIKTVSEQSKIPVIKHFEGVCHVFIDATADVKGAISIALDSKCLMPEVCNAMETLLVHAAHTKNLAEIVEAFRKHGVTVRGCQAAKNAVPDIEDATEDDWRTEYLDEIVSVRIVPDVAAAIEHINRYGSHHTDTIVTDSAKAAQRFLREVDSSVVLENASTMFCDGESLGMGAEIGISTDKIHARGPMGLEDLTSYKFVIRGQGHTMGEYPKF